MIRKTLIAAIAVIGIGAFALNTEAAAVKGYAPEVAHPVTKKPVHPTPIEIARAKKKKAHAALVNRIRTAPVTYAWENALNAYTGGSYGVDHVNALWPLAPKHGKRRAIVLATAVRYNIPFRLLLGIWGAESTFGQYACHFGLTGNFPGVGTSGNFATDARIASQILRRLRY